MFYSNVETMRKLNLPKTWSKLHRIEYQIRYLKKTFQLFNLSNFSRLYVTVEKAFQVFAGQTVTW